MPSEVMATDAHTVGGGEGEESISVGERERMGGGAHGPELHRVFPQRRCWLVAG